jgi:hypothetical protein
MHKNAAAAALYMTVKESRSIKTAIFIESYYSIEVLFVKQTMF